MNQGEKVNQGNFRIHKHARMQETATAEAYLFRMARNKEINKKNYHYLKHIIGFCYLTE